jgi:septal ring factor EnvC (AmiA/AmiB activator)
MRAAREHPRLVIAKALAGLLLVAAGIAIGTAMDSGRREVPHGIQVRLVSAEQSARDQNGELERTSAELKRVTAARTRTEHTLRGLRGANRRLRRDLRVAERSLRRAKRRR